MPDNVTPGAQTSEYSLTKLQVALGTAAIVIGALVDLVPELQKLHPSVPWLGTSLIVLGVLKNVLSVLGYQKSRAQVKAASLLADAAAKDSGNPSQPQG
jgi:hypothetical protein